VRKSVSTRLARQWALRLRILREPSLLAVSWPPHRCRNLRGIDGSRSGPSALPTTDRASAAQPKPLGRGSSTRYDVMDHQIQHHRHIVGAIAWGLVPA